MKKWMNVSLMALMMVAFTMNVSAQDRAEKMDKRMDKVFKKLELTDQEIARVKPILKDFRENEIASHEALKAKRPSKEKMKNLSDREIEMLIESRFRHEQERLDRKRALHNRLKAVLPMKKVAKLHLLMDRNKKGKKGRRGGKEHRGNRDRGER